MRDKSDSEAVLSLPPSPVGNGSPTGQEMPPAMSMSPHHQFQSTLVRPTATAWPPTSTVGDFSRLPFPSTPSGQPKAPMPPFFMNPQCYAPILQQLQNQQRTPNPGSFFSHGDQSPAHPSAYYSMLRSSPAFAAMGMLNPALVMPFGLLPPQMPGGFLPPHLQHLPPGFHPPEEPKPPHSYIGLIAMAILSSPDKKLVLSDIYQWILDHYPYFRTRGPGWRNSIRHNLSLNDCFMKSGRSANGKGHYWAIHPANVSDFQRGDFRRRKAQRKVRRHMGLEPPGPDDEDDEDDVGLAATSAFMRHPIPNPHFDPAAAAAAAAAAYNANSLRNKRTFDMASLLAPDTPNRFMPAPTMPVFDHHHLPTATSTTADASSPEPPTKRLRKDDESSDDERLHVKIEADEEIDVLSSGADVDVDADTTASDEKEEIDKTESPDQKPILRPNFDLAAFYADYAARVRLAASAAFNPVTSEEVKSKVWFNPQGFFPYPPTSEAGEPTKKPEIRVSPFLEEEQSMK